MQQQIPPRELLSFGTLQWPAEDEIWELLNQMRDSSNL